jgi:hypothetical protein
LTSAGEDHSSVAASSDPRIPRAESESLGRRLPPSRAIRQINDALSAETSPSGFLSAAENTLLAVSDDFTGKLGIEAIGIARSRNATAVDKQDVLDADRRLRGTNNSEKQAWLLALAGLLGGGAIAALVALLLAPPPVAHAIYWWLCISLLFLTSCIFLLISYPRHARNGRR